MALLLLAACAKGGEEEVPVVVDGAAAATVNGQKIYVSDVELEAVARGLISAGETFGPKDASYKLILNQLIDQKLMAQEAVRRGLDQDPASLRRLEMARERILGNLLVEDMVAREVTDETIDRMYAEQASLQQANDEVSIAHILVATEAEAQDIYDRIQAGESFENMVRSHSTDSATRMENGDLGYVSPNDQPDPFPVMIADTPVGQVSKPFKGADGWHILKVKDRRTRAPKTRDEMRPEIVTFLTLNRISQILRELRTEAVIQEGSTASVTIPARQLDIREDSLPPEPAPADAPEGNEL
ncbi:peptidylprolyl isomerase [Hyphomonas johnsonii]|jgi:peptidyl-prolyl cis-trans isomerase C|uniref:Parvulin-like PPIase n=1 Tax=Hyphomonas johnsonii MHS-2 TaxID=1280950 RepID=A0A059FPN4_9PROT|nr:peptidylprolyl isomerase [Hyphomonas johnsonii]KCZ92433.1 peptidyl-prolyl cis-trans isomerase domain-containing protein [Hyphomonas johnsonii MHS-2]